MSHSRNSEELVIAMIIDGAPDIPKVCVDIGASYGSTWSNVGKLLEDGWKGLLVECDPEKSPQLITSSAKFGVKVETTKCTPINVCQMLAAHGIPSRFGVLSLDIDGYDYHVLRALLRTHKPDIICCELNQCVPPPYKFAVNFDPAYWWGSNPFFGMSIAAVHELLTPRGYKLIEIVDDNAIFSIHGEGKELMETWRDSIDSGEDNWGKQQSRHIAAMPEAEAIHYIYDGMWGGCIGKFEVWL